MDDYLFSFGHSLIKTFLSWEQRRCKKILSLSKMSRHYSWDRKKYLLYCKHEVEFFILIVNARKKKNWHKKIIQDSRLIQRMQLFYLKTNIFLLWKMRDCCFRLWLFDPLQRLQPSQLFSLNFRLLFSFFSFGSNFLL